MPDERVRFYVDNILTDVRIEVRKTKRYRWLPRFLFEGTPWYWRTYEVYVLHPAPTNNATIWVSYITEL